MTNNPFGYNSLMPVLLHLSSAFGLSASAGLNAYIPLLIISIMARLGSIHLAAPYDLLGSTWCLCLLVVLCIIEIIVDKIPGADHINDIVQSFIRPTAGAILFASQIGVIKGVHPAVWIVVGLVLAGGVHTAKALSRPVINTASFGIGAPIVSALEDLVATVTSLLAVLFPILAGLFLVIAVWILIRAFRLFRRKRTARIPVSVQAVYVPDQPAWRGGI